MREFGSDFQLIDAYNSGRAHLTDVFRGATLLADGRQCIVALIRQYGLRRLWLPDYFCYEVVETIKEQTGVEIMLYKDSPLKECDVERLPYKNGDALLRMNFFGMRDFRSNKNIPVLVIEDHSHDPFGHWALYSDADWCISSIRKTLPLPEGGMMWSPRGHLLSIPIPSSSENEKIASTRWEGMEMKAKYLIGQDVSKDNFRKKYTETEEWFDYAEPAQIDKRSKQVISEQLDINMWLGAKRKNWKLLNDLIDNTHCVVIKAEHESCTMFSMVILLDSKMERDEVRKRLIEKSVYPAILWNVSDKASVNSRDFSERMLSIHCDGRYSEEDIRQLAGILNSSLVNLNN